MKTTCAHCHGPFEPGERYVLDKGRGIHYHAACFSKHTSTVSRGQWSCFYDVVPPDGLDRRFPIQGGASVPWSVAEEAYRTYSNAYGTQQSLERLAERGGFGGMEFAMLLYGRTDVREHDREKMIAHLINRLL